MASTTAKPLETAATPPPNGGKRGRGRPPKAAQLFADPEDQIGLPPTPKPDQETFFAYWAEVEERWPKRTVAYLYRGWPKIRRSEDNGANIHTGGFFTLDWLTQTWGTGEYLIILNDPYRQPRNQQTLCKCVVRINDPTLPPKLDINELDMQWPANQQFIADLRMRGVKLPGDDSLPPKVATALEAIARKTEPDPAQRQNSELLNATFATLLQNTLDPTKQLAQLERMLSLARPADSNATLAPMLALFQSMLQQQQEQHKETLKMLGQRPAPAPTPEAPADPLTERFKQVMLDRMMDQIENPEPPAAGPDGSPWLGLLAPLLGKGLEIAGAFVGAYAQRAAIETAAAQQRQPMQQPQHMPVPMHQQPQPWPTPMPEAEEDEEEDEEEGVPQQVFTPAMILKAIKPQLLQALTLKWTGRQFRAEMERLYGLLIVGQIANQPEASRVMLDSMKADADLGQLLTAQPAELQKFVEDFLSNEPEPAAPKKRTK